jgi:hypothetical protein
MTPLPAELSDLAAMAALAPILAQAFVSLACDIALVLDPQGLVTYMAHGDALALAPIGALWVGRPWTETVTPETRPKIEALLAEVSATGHAPLREVTLAASFGPAIPVAYAALRLGPSGPTLAVGRDLRAAASLQERFLKAQRELEQGYQMALGGPTGGAAGALRPAGGQSLAARAMVNLIPAAAELLGLAGREPEQGELPGRPRSASPYARAGRRRQTRRPRRRG